MGIAKGSNHYCAKLTAEKAREIVRRYKKGGVSTYALADEYDVIQASIMQVLTGRSWSHATGIKPGESRRRSAKISREIIFDLDDLP